MPVLEDPWTGLSRPSRPADIFARRVSESGKWSFYWARDEDGHCLLVFRHDHPVTSHLRLPHLKGVEVLSNRTDDAGPTLVFRLTDSSLREVFLVLCIDIIQSTETAGSEGEALDVAVRRTWRWHHLLRGGGTGLLSGEEQKGLIGELLVLEKYFLKAFEPGEAIDCWRGPLGSAQDFSTRWLSVESKARSSSMGNRVHISSEYQLDAPTPELFLHVSIVDVAGDEDAASFSVSDVASRVGAVIRQRDAGVAERYSSLLSAAGLREQDDYSGSRWVEGEHCLYRVSEAFPRLVPATLPSGILDTRYVLSLAECGSFAVTPDVLDTALRGEHQHGR